MPAAITNLKTKQTSIKLDMRRLQKIYKECPERADAIASQVAHQVQAEAIIRAPRDPKRPPKDQTRPVTGFLKASIQVEKVAEALYWVIVGAFYGIFQEFGTSRMPARPFLYPAAMKLEKALPKLIKENLIE